MARHPDDDWKQRVAWMASPWEWSGRAITVLGVVIVGFAVFATLKVLLGNDVTVGHVVGPGVGLALYSLLLGRPYVKSVRKWRELH